MTNQITGLAGPESASASVSDPWEQTRDCLGSLASDLPEPRERRRRANLFQMCRDAPREKRRHVCSERRGKSRRFHGDVKAA